MNLNQIIDELIAAREKLGGEVPVMIPGNERNQEMPVNKIETFADLGSSFVSLTSV